MRSINNPLTIAQDIATLKSAIVGSAMKVVTAEEMRRIDQECIRMGTPGSVLMENAGKAVAEETRRILESVKQQRILVLIGPGNNGGDGLVAARHLHDWGARVSLYLCSERPPGDANLEQVQERGINCIEAAADEDLGEFDRLLSSASCVIDALFGTGKTRPLQGIPKQVLERVNSAKSKNEGLRIIAIDLPLSFLPKSLLIKSMSPIRSKKFFITALMA